MSYAGDFAVGTTFDVKFTTRRFSTGAPFTLAGTPAISAYPDNSTTELTAGITLSVDFDARTGLNNVRVVATVGNGYAAGSSYALVITAGTVDGVSVVGEVIGEFTLDRSALAADALAEIKTQVVAALNTDTYAESAAVPAATATLVAKIAWLATLARNKILQTATTQTLRNDADTVTVATAAVSDDGTTFIRNEWT